MFLSVDFFSTFYNANLPESIPPVCAGSAMETLIPAIFFENRHPSLSIRGCTSPLTLRGLTAEEALGRPHCYTLEFTSTDNALDPAAFLMQNATLLLQRKEATGVLQPVRVVQGVVSRVKKRPASGDAHRYKIVLPPRQVLPLAPLAGQQEGARNADISVGKKRVTGVAHALRIFLRKLHIPLFAKQRAPKTSLTAARHEDDISLAAQQRMMTLNEHCIESAMGGEEILRAGYYGLMAKAQKKGDIDPLSGIMKNRCYPVNDRLDAKRYGITKNLDKKAALYSETSDTIKMHSIFQIKAGLK